MSYLASKKENSEFKSIKPCLKRWLCFASCLCKSVIYIYIYIYIHIYQFFFMYVYLIAWMLICHHRFQTVFLWQSSGRKRNILKKMKKSKRHSQKNVYVRIAYKSCVCVCVDYIFVLLRVVVYMIFSVCVCVCVWRYMHHVTDLWLSHKYMSSDVEQKVSEIERRLGIWPNKKLFIYLLLSLLL